MEINKTTDVNFGARRILTSTQKLKNGIEDTVEVFLLKKGEDDSFVRTCIHGLNENKGRLTPKQSKLSKIFKSFNREGTDNDLYVAIKDGELVMGATNVLRSQDWHCIKDFVSLTENKQTGYSLLQAMMNNAKGKLRNLCGKFLSGYDNEIMSLPVKNKNIEFHTHNEPSKINLLDYLDIDFQNRV